MSVDHYENFPVASWLCPRPLRHAVRAIYHFARTADDLADEGDASPEVRLADLQAYRADLRRIAGGAGPSERWAWVFGPLAEAMVAHRLPEEPLADLLDAFAQDVVKQRYADRVELLDYCQRSAAPVGRLLLHLYGVDDDASLRRSDAICIALQLINFWQDLGIDCRRGRVYAPLQDLDRHAVDVTALMTGQDSPGVRRLVADLCGWSRALMNEGTGLPLRVGGRAGFELRCVMQGGLRILDKIERGGFDSLRHRPVLRLGDAPLLLCRAVTMGAVIPRAIGTTA